MRKIIFKNSIYTFFIFLMIRLNIFSVKTRHSESLRTWIQIICEMLDPDPAYWYEITDQQPWSKYTKYRTVSSCTGAFLYVPYCFLLIVNKFYGLSLLHWSLHCSAVRKIYCTLLPPPPHLGKWDGLGPGNLYFFGPQMARAWRLDMPFHRAQKSLGFQGPTPSQLPS